MEDKINKIIEEAKADSEIEGFHIESQVIEAAQTCLIENDSIDALVNQIIRGNKLNN